MHKITYTSIIITPTHVFRGLFTCLVEVTGVELGLLLAPGVDSDVCVIVLELVSCCFICSWTDLSC